MTKITRNVVSDLWPLYAAGEASADTRALVEAFLADDPDFARTLKGAFDVPAAEVALPPDGEARALARTRKELRGGGWLRGLRLVALTLTVLALVRIGGYFELVAVRGRSAPTGAVETLVVSAVVAAVAWGLYVVLVWRAKKRALRITRPRAEK